MESGAPLKLNYAGEVRRIRLARKDAFGELVQYAQAALGVTVPVFSYVDDDGDTIVVSGAEELAEALTAAAPGKPLRLTVQEGPVASDFVMVSSRPSTPQLQSSSSESLQLSSYPASEDGHSTAHTTETVAPEPDVDPEPEPDVVARKTDAEPGDAPAAVIEPVAQPVAVGVTTIECDVSVDSLCAVVKAALEGVSPRITRDLIQGLQQLGLSNVPGGAAAAPAASKPAPAQPVPQEPVDLTIHPGVVCDECGSAIMGVRYKCGHCVDFDLCMACEAKPSTMHDPNHVLLKIRNPLPTPAGPRRHRPLLPPLHGEETRRPLIAPRRPVEEAPLFPRPSRFARTAAGPQPPNASLSATFVRDVNFPDASEVPAGSVFYKTWCMRNSGTLPWPTGCQLVRQGAGSRGAIMSVGVPAAQPGQSVNVSVGLVAPATPGRYVTHWRLADADGTPFGHRIWCDVVVVLPAATPAPAYVQTAQPSTPSGPQAAGSAAAMPSAPARPADADDAVRSAQPSASSDENTLLMRRLFDMGFYDAQTNWTLIYKYNGDLNRIVSELCG